MIFTSVNTTESSAFEIENETAADVVLLAQNLFHCEEHSINSFQKNKNISRF